jgi:hypothetical protein
LPVVATKFSDELSQFPGSLQQLVQPAEAAPA